MTTAGGGSPRSYAPEGWRRELYLWLRREPEPVKLRAISADGEDREVVMGQKRTRYADAAGACLGAVSIEALDEQGRVIRAWHAKGYEPATPAPPGQDVAAIVPDSASQSVVHITRALTECVGGVFSNAFDAMGSTLRQQAQLLEHYSKTIREQNDHIAELQDEIANLKEERAEERAENNKGGTADIESEVKGMVLKVGAERMMKEFGFGHGNGQGTAG